MTIPREFFPEPEILMTLPTEEVAHYLLVYLKNLEHNNTTLHLTNVIGPSAVQGLAGNPVNISCVLAEAWEWLRTQGLVAQDPRRQAGWSFVTRRGNQIKDKAGFEAMQKAALLPRKLIHPDFSDKVIPIFIRGDYDVAVFQAFKQVEVSVRTAANLTDKDYGVDLMRKAFHFETGPLTDKTRIVAERESMAHLFAGAIGHFKNPVSHRDVPINDPAEAAEMIIMASHLLRLVELRNEALSKKQEAKI